MNNLDARLYSEKLVVTTGSINGYDYAIVGADFPKVYVRVADASPAMRCALRSLYGYEGPYVHGSVTYADLHAPSYIEGSRPGRWIGWDYHHTLDYNIDEPDDRADRYTMSDILNEIVSCICQLDEFEEDDDEE